MYHIMHIRLGFQMHVSLFTISAGMPEHGFEGGGTPPTLKERGQGGNSALPMLSPNILFHIFFFHSFLTQDRSLFILKNS